MIENQNSAQEPPQDFLKAKNPYDILGATPRDATMDEGRERGFVKKPITNQTEQKVVFDHGDMLS